MVLDQRVDRLPPTADPRAGALHDRWSALQVDGGPPDREALDVFALRPWLGHISVYEAIDGGADFRIRLEGTRIAAMTGEDWTGRRASDVDSVFGTDLCGELRRALETAQARFHTTRIYQRDYQNAVRMLLPVRSRRDGPIDQILLVLYLDPGQQR